MQPTPKQQEWGCVLCNVEGATEYESTSSGTGTNPFTAIQAILADHSQRSPECSGGLNTIRLNPNAEA